MALMWVGWLIYFILAIIVLNLIRVPAHLPWWFGFFVVLFIAPAILTPIMRGWITHLRAKALLDDLAELRRDFDEIAPPD
jgi:hypothetical protein